MQEVDDIVGIFPGDLIIKTAIELGLNDMRKNPWLIEDAFRILIENPILKRAYGMKEIDNAKEFILNNKVNVYMRHRIDKMEYPCITISTGKSKESEELATLGDQSVAVELLSPEDIGQTISYIVPPFTPSSYDPATGIVEVPTNLYEYTHISKDMIAVDPETGNGFIIEGKAGDNGFKIKENSKLPNGKIGVIPKYHQYKARREVARSKEQYNIGCHVHGDVSTLIFLYAVVKYSLFRYREGLLEYNNFQLSTLESTDLIKNDYLDTENVFSRWIVLSGQVEETWIKSPKRFIESISLVDPDREDFDVFQTGIKIISNEDSDAAEDDNDLWETIDGDSNE